MGKKEEFTGDCQVHHGNIEMQGLASAIVHLASYMPQKMQEAGDEPLCKLVIKAREYLNMILDQAIAMKRQKEE